MPVRVLLAGAAALAWTALLLRLYLTLALVDADGGSPLEALAVYLSFFTILTNILAAAVLTVWAARPECDWFLTRPGVRAATVVYLGVVGVVYAILLRNLWDPQGLTLFCDIVLHDLMPLLYAACWLAATPKGRLRWRQPAWWTLYPGAYFLYALTRGAVSGVYAYPFIDVAALGYTGVMLNAVILLGVFWGLGLLLVALDRQLGRRRAG